jgi:hypothetical protein
MVPCTTHLVAPSRVLFHAELADALENSSPAQISFFSDSKILGRTCVAVVVV